MIDKTRQEAVRTQQHGGMPMSKAVVDEQLLPYSSGLVDNIFNREVGLKHLKPLAARHVNEWQGRDNGSSFQKPGRKRAASSLRNLGDALS